MWKYSYLFIYLFYSKLMLRQMTFMYMFQIEAVK